ncbi:MAG: DUF3365 domain-containing protein [Capnocytophaga sp.]|nr:DUF3365 domain-containing protein [Capnocytophaga sp.]
MKSFYLSLIVALLVSCNSSPKVLSEIEKEKYIALGNKITTETQKFLLMNVSEKIKEVGFAGAVDFCNENAVKLTNSLADNTFEIKRLSNKNRNRSNKISSEIDQKAWKKISVLMKDSSKPEKHLLLEDNDKVYYYKAIPLGMPTCLVCHGSKQDEIPAEVQQIIATKYPDDKATDYKMGELRGIWKMTFERK